MTDEVELPGLSASESCARTGAAAGATSIRPGAYHAPTGRDASVEWNDDRCAAEPEALSRRGRTMCAPTGAEQAGARCAPLRGRGTKDERRGTRDPSSVTPQGGVTPSPQGEGFTKDERREAGARCAPPLLRHSERSAAESKNPFPRPKLPPRGELIRRTGGGRTVRAPTGAEQAGAQVCAPTGAEQAGARCAPLRGRGTKDERRGTRDPSSVTPPCGVTPSPQGEGFTKDERRGTGARVCAPTGAAQRATSIRPGAYHAPTGRDVSVEWNINRCIAEPETLSRCGRTVCAPTDRGFLPP